MVQLVYNPARPTTSSHHRAPHFARRIGNGNFARHGRCSLLAEMAEIRHHRLTASAHGLPSRRRRRYSAGCAVLLLAAVPQLSAVLEEFEPDFGWFCESFDNGGWEKTSPLVDALKVHRIIYSAAQADPCAAHAQCTAWRLHSRTMLALCGLFIVVFESSCIQVAERR